jgi:hypothetical protein
MTATCRPASEAATGDFDLPTSRTFRPTSLPVPSLAALRREMLT